MTIKSFLLPVGIFFAVGFICVFIEMRFSKKKDLIRQRLPVLLNNSTGEIADRDLRRLLYENGIKLSYEEFKHIMIKLEEEDVVARRKTIDAEGRVTMIRLLVAAPTAVVAT